MAKLIQQNKLRANVLQGNQTSLLYCDRLWESTDSSGIFTLEKLFALLQTRFMLHQPTEQTHPMTAMGREENQESKTTLFIIELT